MLLLILTNSGTSKHLHLCSILGKLRPGHSSGGLVLSFQYYFILGTMGTLVAYFTNIGWNEDIATLKTEGGRRIKVKKKKKKKKTY